MVLIFADVRGSLSKLGYLKLPYNGVVCRYRYVQS